MANEFQPFGGPHVLDLQPVSTILVEVADGGIVGFRREKPEWNKAKQELSTALPLYASALRVTPDLATQFDTLDERIDQVRHFRLIAEKMLGALKDTEAYLEDEREAMVGLVVDSARKAAKRKDPGLISAFEETIRYHGQIARQSVKTRRKNEAAAAEAEAEAESDAAEPPAPPPPAQQRLAAHAG